MKYVFIDKNGNEFFQTANTIKAIQALSKKYKAITAMPIEQYKELKAKGLNNHLVETEYKHFVKAKKQPFEKVVSELQDAISLIEHVRDKKQQADSNALTTFAANIQRIGCMLNEAIKTLDKI